VSTDNRHRDDLAASVKTKPAMLVLIGSDCYILNESDASQQEALGQAVYDRRTVLGISQAELAAQAGTTQTVISRLEGGAVTPTPPLLQRLASALEGELDLKITGTSLRAEFPLAS